MRLMLYILLKRQSMALFVDIIHGRGPNDEMIHTQLRPKKNKAALNVNIAAKGIICAVHH